MSGGSGYWNKPGVPLPDLYRSAQAGSDQAQYEAETEGLLRDLLKAYNQRDAGAIQTHLASIEQAMSREIEGTLKMLFGGSVGKHTFVNGLSDIDMLVCLNDTSLSGKTPNEVLAYMERTLRQRYPRTEIKVGDLAVTVSFSDHHKIQLLPAVRTARGFRIAEPGENRWSNVVAPRRFAQKLTEVNQHLGGRVIPIIKLAKAMNEKLPKPQRLSGYHMEAIAIEAFKAYDGRRTNKEMLRHFWTRAQALVLEPIRDSTGQSRHVDDDLGIAHSTARLQVSQRVGRMLERMNQADNLRSADTWKEMIEL